LYQEKEKIFYSMAKGSRKGAKKRKEMVALIFASLAIL
jgi:hypothetical protein